MTPADQGETPMQDHEFDELLRLGAARPSAAATAAATELAERTRAHADAPLVNSRPVKQRPWSRRLVLAGGVLAGVAVLSAGASVAAYQMSIPPFQSLPPGLQRVDSPIPLD
ncbi:hypothetical protein GCM10023317_24750 [Actinopolymorpha pittospori]